jgi:peptidoglycan hydrolase-like protein with peptidoglycan-binding domain
MGLYGKGKYRKILGIALSASTAFAGVANANDDLVRGLLGLGTAIILNQAAQQNQQPRYQGGVQRAPGEYDDEVAKRVAARREVQRRLNMLGFEAGQPDGSFGPQTREAIAAFQRSVGHRPTGKITEAEITLLYQRSNAAMAGGGGEENGNGVAAEGGVEEGFATLGNANPPVSAFPALGGGANNAPQGTNAFSTVGNPAPAANGKAAFPVIGNAAGQQAAPHPSAFPQIGKAAPAGGNSSAFPALGKLPEGNAAATSKPVPAAPDGGAIPATGAQMPAIAAAPTQQDAATQMPPLATAPAATTAPPAVGDTASSPAPAFSPLSAAPVKPDSPTSMPAIATAPDVEAAATSASLSSELKYTPFGSEAEQPKILGFSLGSSLKDAQAHLADAGFADCKPAAGALECTRTTASLSDTIRIWTSQSETIFGIARAMAFNTAVPSDALTKQFETTYGALMKARAYTVSSKPECSAPSLSRNQIQPLLNHISAVESKTAADIEPAMIELARTCPIGYSIAFNGGEKISGVEITFLDATSLINAAAQKDRELAQRKKEAEAAKAEEEQKKLQTLSSDIKL